MKKIKKNAFVKSCSLLTMFIIQISCSGLPEERSLEERFFNPPVEDRIAFTWFWSNAIDKAAITRDLEEMSRVGAGQFEITENIYDALCAEIIINNNTAGVLWCSPYQTDISGLLKPGTNKIQINITSTLHNWRLANQFTAGAGSIHSHQPVSGPHPWELIGLALPPSPSGLPGPVTLTIYK
jgi:hypothetical protein